MSHGVDVVLDKWDLKEGQDKYAFMERCVNDSEITKVLIICDKAYAQKANERTGGVGDETVIISSEIYGNTKQEKFIPIIAERDEEGQPYAPTYIKTRIYIDLSNQETYEVEYEKLLRNIYEKPQFVKPKLGKRPEWIDDAKTDFFLVEAIPWSSISDCSPTRQQILTFGEQYIGTPYVYGGTSLTGGIDCSSFVQQCYASAGFSLPRTSREQATRGTQITLNEAKPGDLLFYADATGTIDHVVMYLGDGKILHAALSLGQVTISKYNYSTEPVRVVNIIGD